MPDPLVAAAESLLDELEVTLRAGFNFPVLKDRALALRAALAAHRQRDERAEAAVAVLQGEQRLEALLSTNVYGISPDEHRRLREDIDNTRLGIAAARRRWAEVEGRRA